MATKLIVDSLQKSGGTTFTLPSSDGSSGQAMVTNGSGTLSFSAAGATITDDTTTNGTRYLLWDDATSGSSTSIGVSSTKLTWNPSTGTLAATIFSGTATTAQYADLAENYVSDSTYAVGTVLVFGGTQEVTISNTKEDKRIAGVVSSNPAYLMNSECNGEYIVPITLQGRVPCRVIGVVEKGDIIVSSDVNGVGVAWNESHNPTTGSVIGKSLENKNTNDEDIIEVVVGVR